ncbi:MAG TPA: hypothetical protein DFS52_17235, partial [Myxococcales bacterium]|nr:hypothetical protein [Myxococcales bacterium]
RPGSGGVGSSSGGSYGGKGGSTSNSVYGNYAAPIDLGSGGYGSQTPGGGAVRIALGSGSLLTLDGEILSNGTNSWCCGYGGGAGGSVYVTTSTLVGSGVIAAKGGNGSSWWSGGGGRIAVDGLAVDGLGGAFYSDPFDHLLAQGGGGTRVAAAGTVFLKTIAQQWGDLIIDNKTVPAVTHLPDLPLNVADQVDADRLITLALTMTPDYYAGL